MVAPWSYKKIAMVTTWQEARREAMVRAAPETFAFDVPSMPFLEVRLEAISRDELIGLLREVWRLAASKSMVRALDYAEAET